MKKLLADYLGLEEDSIERYYFFCENSPTGMSDQWARYKVIIKNSDKPKIVDLNNLLVFIYNKK